MYKRLTMSLIEPEWCWHIKEIYLLYCILSIPLLVPSVHSTIIKSKTPPQHNSFNRKQTKVKWDGWQNFWTKWPSNNNTGNTVKKTWFICLLFNIHRYNWPFPSGNKTLSQTPCSRVQGSVSSSVWWEGVESDSTNCCHLQQRSVPSSLLNMSSMSPHLHKTLKIFKREDFSALIWLSSLAPIQFIHYFLKSIFEKQN